MSKTGIRYSTFPLTEPPQSFVEDLVAVFAEAESVISTIQLDKGLRSNEVLEVVRPGLAGLGFFQIQRSQIVSPEGKYS